MPRIFDEYNYDVPPELIASVPASPRDSSRLFVYNTATNEISFDTFSNISNYLPPESLLVLNNTKVVPARSILKKESGAGSVEILFLVNEYVHGTNTVRGMVDRKVTIGDTLVFAGGEKMKAVDQDAHIFTFEFLFPAENFFAVLAASGVTPLPRYIKNVSLSEPEIRERYQSIFAKNPASAAAPTASLHITPEVLQSIDEAGHEMTEISLHVGLGTFAPVTEENLKEGKLHSERYEIGETVAATIAGQIKNKKPVFAVGTTALRTLESVARDNDGLIVRSEGETNLFIRPGFEFKAASGLITNFHVPRSSLMALVDAFLKHKKAQRGITELYSIAIAEKFRFFSLGDAMLIV